MYSWWWVRLLPETCRVKPLRRIKRKCCILLDLFHYSYMCSRWWVKIPPETCRAVFQKYINCIKLHLVGNISKRIYLRCKDPWTSNTESAASESVMMLIHSKKCLHFGRNGPLFSAVFIMSTETGFILRLCDTATITVSCSVSALFTVKFMGSCVSYWLCSKLLLQDLQTNCCCSLPSRYALGYTIKFLRCILLENNKKF